jgi:hypothetical protein
MVKSETQQLKAKIREKLGELRRLEDEVSDVSTHRYQNIQRMTGDEIKANRQKEAELNQKWSVMDRELKALWDEYNAPRESKGIEIR